MRELLLLSHGAEVSGAERSLLALAAALDPDRYRASLALPGPGPLVEAARRAGIATHQVNTIPASLRSPASLARNWRVLRALTARAGTDLLHANSFHAVKQAAPLALVPGLAIVTSIRDIVPMTRPTLAALMRSRLVACVSDATRDHVRALLAPAQHARVRTVYNGVDPASMRAPRPVDRDALLGTSCGGDVIAGMLAPLVRWKGQELLLRAAARARARGAPLRVVIAGGEQFCEEGYREELEALAEGEELAGRVHFLGQRSDVPEILAALDLVVCASTSPDPFPRAILEAMAAGRAVIGPEAGGVPEQIVQGESGWLFREGDEDALAALLADLADDEDARRRAGLRAAERCAREFSLERHAAAMQALYDEALGTG